jgi:hypothetical protein
LRPVNAFVPVSYQQGSSHSHDATVEYFYAYIYQYVADQPTDTAAAGLATTPGGTLRVNQPVLPRTHSPRRQQTNRLNCQHFIQALNFQPVNIVTSADNVILLTSL